MIRLSSTPATLALLSATAIGIALPVQAQDANCMVPLGGALPAGCETPDAGDVVSMPTGVNTEPEAAQPALSNSGGFVLSLDGDPVDADPTVEDRIRRTDIALAQAEVQVTFDGLEPEPTLDLEIAGEARAYRPGDRVELLSQTNYPAFIERAEMRIFDRGATGGPRLLAVVPVAPNGRVAVTLPDGRDLVAVHRVYDKRGRYDETGPLPLGYPDDRGLVADIEEVSDFTARRGIPIRGGMVTVRAKNAAPGAKLYTLGTEVPASPDGTMVIRRILPAGEYAVGVEVKGGATPVVESYHDVEIPGAEWFYVVVGDVTVGRYEDGRTGDSETRSDGRLQVYVDGETEGGIGVTASLDTGEFELDEILDRLEDKDVEGILDRIEQGLGYPTYGDDSTIEDNTPTSGRFYLRVEREGSYALWGDYQARLTGNAFLRNERTLYGAQVHYESQATTARGDNRVTVDAYAAQPDQLVGRDVFRGTGGSVYFLSAQDIAVGTETLTVELRDAATGRVVARETLVQGQDYDINYVQGVVTLRRPLSGSVSPNLIQTNPGGDQNINLVAQYEFTPATGDVDSYSIGGRVEAWVTDDVRLGFTIQNEDTGTADQDAVGIDLRWEFGANSFAQLDYAETDGPGFGTSFSLDGGLSLDGEDPVDGDGRAIRFETQMDLADLGLRQSGIVGAYYEHREEGFSTLDYQVDAATGDETIYGVFGRIEANERLSYAFYFDRYENDEDVDRTEIGAEVAFALTDRLDLALAVEHLEEDSPDEDGNRTTVGGRLSYAVAEGTEIYGFGQFTADSDGLDDFDRYGVGVDHDFRNGWEVEAEVSGGDGGTGARLLANYAREDNSSYYFGYELDPGRRVDPDLTGEDGGRFVMGGRQQINDDLILFAENSYDLFGERVEHLETYGAEYRASRFLTFTGSIEGGEVNDGVDGDFDRQAYSLGVRYQTERLTARARIEYRDDDTERDDLGDTEFIFFAADARWQINDESRLLFRLAHADSDSDGESVASGDYTDLSLGYAYRPIENERLNVLARYRYLRDFIGQEVDGSENDGPIQESHIFSVEGSYDLSPVWTLGGKLGGRLGKSAAGEGEPLADNDAYLAVVNVRGHIVHNWDFLVEGRYLDAVDAETSRSGVLAAAYRHFGNNLKVGAGYNFSTFSDDLSDLTYDDKGLFLNVIAKF
ncbi:hypothetical protein [Jannaschia aquimarina]|uniref:Uncharacterized protein n=1 Tax=Jannaschia aquimarina TaxID=935700 RepID=A0A0D1EBT2_9RHOB|nr:hypothetical protein [Jannaschia aquimarina]KIT14311.1 hypothetical protein jaqu_41050 [Jannaschia aquimarina]SNS50621.1 hypothetical protein SAMN05421775_101224 [Jannaschia aquimarina]